MPKPASRAGDSDNGGGNDQTAASTTTNATDGQNTDSGEADADQSLETPGEPDEEGENVAGMCTVVVRVDEDTKSVDEFIILEHVKRMAQDPSAAVSALPTYQDFIVQFPEYMWRLKLSLNIVMEHFVKLQCGISFFATTPTNVGTRQRQQSSFPELHLEVPSE